MGVSNEELLKSIRHYQESLDKYTSSKNNYKLLNVIEKLKRLPIATSHLEDTGIGRTVNALRKLGGEVGDAAKGLVARWKEMVVEEEIKAKNEALDESVDTSGSTENDTEIYDECYEEAPEDIKEKENVSTSSHILSDSEKKGNDEYKKESDKRTSSSSRKHTSSEKKDRHRDRDSSSKKRKQDYHSDSEGHTSKKRHRSSSSESEEDIYEETPKSKSHRRHRSESSEEDDRKNKSKKSKYSSDDSDSEDSYKEHKSRSSSSSKNHRSSSQSKSSEKTESKKHDYDSHLKDEKSKSRHKSDIKSKRESDCEESKSSSKHKSKRESEDSKSRSKHESKRHEKESSKSKESKSHLSRSEKHDTKEKKESKTSESKERHNHKKDDNRKHEEKHKKSKDEKENGKKEKSSSSSKTEENSKNSNSSSKHKSSSDRKKDKEKVKPIDKEKIVNGIDSGSGASFADALGMCGPMISSKAPISKKKKSTSVTTPEKPRASSSYAKPETYKDEDDDDDDDNVPSLLRQEPEPLNINISSLLPEITPHYKPLGLPLDSQPRKILSQDEALSQVISNKNMRTKVYSGNKSYGKVETLFDLCVRVLQDNIDALEYTGGVPYSILKPVLERATPDQLFNLEHHNPYLVEETGELWHLHCQKEFRTKKREEMESWRDMYMRCLDEREARLNAITANIKQSQDKSTPVRTTKLAYVDSVVKPPRNIARKQAKNGIIIDKKPAQTPSSRLSALATSGDAGKVAVPNPGSRAVERSSSSTSSAAALKPKKAPLMAKTLSLFKNRFRR